ncbi:hypothetical protein [Isoptericola sp. NPDC055881]
MTASETRSRRHRSRATWLLPLLVPLTACAGGPGKAPASTGEELFAERAPLASCGDVTTRPGRDEGAPTAELAEGYACLDAAAAGEGAELVVRFLTVEGDPVVQYWRTGPGIDGLEGYTDGTQDRFGAGLWTYQACPENVTAAEPRGCEAGPLVEG